MTEETPETEKPETEVAETEVAETGRPADALGKVKGFVEEHPVAMVAGGILVGALVAGALSRASSGVAGDKATRKGTLSRMSLPRRAVDLATLGVELAAAYVAGAAGEKAAAGSDDGEMPARPEAAKPALPGLAGKALPGLAGKALTTLAPVISRYLPGKKAE